MPDTTDAALAGRIFDIQRFSIHDGPGIRTTVFLQGCPLDCAWCHNPEGRVPGPQLAFSPTLCIGCGYCLRHCPNGAHVLDGEAHRLDRQVCAACFACAEGCYSGALEVLGSERTVADVLDEVLRDRPFYEESGGGVTLSGGEPLAQPAFAEALLRAAKDAGLHTCLETCGAVPWEDLEAVAPHIDLFLYDWKETDPKRHRAFTGRDNASIRENLRRLHERGADIILRCPVIPGINLRDDHLAGIADLARALPRLKGVKVMAYHRLGDGKRERLGLAPETRLPGDLDNMRPGEAEAVAARLRELGVHQAAAG